MEGKNKRKAGEMANINALATEALKPTFTDELFAQHGQLFTELCAWWIHSGSETEAKIAAFGRIVPLAPHLAEHAERFLESVSHSPVLGNQLSDSPGNHLELSGESNLIELLLGTFRLLGHNCRSFAKYVRPLALESLFRHSSHSVRYLAVRVFCLYVHAADHATQEMLRRFVGEKEIKGPWESQTIDYRFLSLWEEKRWKSVQSVRQQGLTEGENTYHPSIYQGLSPYTVNVNGILIPRLDGAPSQERPAELISTATTETNLKNLAQGLLGSRPLLLTGLAGSGKTLLIRHFAWQLNKLNKMVTLHLNEQSDAKLLVGMYATGAKPGTFSWRAGVLTTAVREGRWIFIEDLDRAPNEVISTLLPLIERGELLIPSRGETVRAARGFRIIATMRSTLNPRGQEIFPRQNMIGHRFWCSISIHMPQLEEFNEVIGAKYPALQNHLSSISGVYLRLLALYSDAKFSSENGTSIRAMTPRDLLKWCARIATLLAQSSIFTTAQKDDIFMEAFDCFAGSLHSETARLKVMSCVAEELHIDPQRRDHLLKNRTVKLALPSKTTATGSIQIGRARLSKHKSTRRSNSGRPFSTNDYTLRLLEKVAVAVDRQEPLLLVGETGTGKTTCIQYLAEQLGRKLVAFNLSQQSESGDLLGGFKPVNVRSLVIPLKDEFDDLFDTTFSRKKNLRFIEMLGKRVAKGEWKRVCTLWREALKMVDATRKSHESRTSSPVAEGGQPKKKRKTDSLPPDFPTARWEKFATDLHDLEAQLASGSEAFAFAFLEGNIVKAVRNGDWVLLDEINLASSDTLEALADLLGGDPDGNPSILLTETGNVERVVAHPNFRVFAAMNPATDVGKKDLPPGIRSRFTELYVESPDSDEKSLRSIVEKYLGGDQDNTDPATVRIAHDVTSLYLEIQQLAKANMLVDGADQKPHFSLRTLTRTLSYARDVAPLCSIRRALYEGFHMSFLTFLNKASEDLVAPLIVKHLFPQKPIMKAELGKPLQQPPDGRSHVKQGHYWLRQGVYVVEEQPHYIITPFVQRNMNNLIRAASTRKYPVLIQGPTSSGKTSMIEYLAKRSGNKFVRINNHEHTDLQEYLGSYISGVDGKLVFQEGILVRALREGHWIVLDELNLAPTDVLEALNRLLDDNRELLIPETQEVVRPHEDFMLFATQNPAGLYGGRKVLSRAFRNRFLELHFDDIPVDELTEILHRRTMIPETWCKRIVKVYRELSTLRQENRLFEQKSFATLRDLFRWAQRKAVTIQDLANNGYMLLAERVRKEEERLAVKRIIETVMSEKGPKVVIDEEHLFNVDDSSLIGQQSNGVNHATVGVVWTRAMRRLFVLVAHALRNNEPVLLIGETGCGKTTVCQLLADHFQNHLHIVNAHQNTETGDLIGAQRPIRNRAAIEDSLRNQVLAVLETVQNGESNGQSTALGTEELLFAFDKIQKDMPHVISDKDRKLIQLTRAKAAALFEWADGSLVYAMKEGHYFLLDEISLADDSVLERLNSVLEPSRTLLLAEKGPTDSLIIATEGFQFLATMNPGGDYGKKELSPALRNRFTEIWVPAMSDLEDILNIVQSKLKPEATQYAGAIVSFSQWFNTKYNTSVSSSISIRDTLAWVSFINKSNHDASVFGVVHGAAMVFIDTLGANPAGLLAISTSSIDHERKECLRHLSELLSQDIAPLYFSAIEISSSDDIFQLGAFAIPKFKSATAEVSNFALEAPTTRSNAMRVVRALQLAKPVLLEGNPGVGKTTLVTALARATGKPLTRLNLSEQTDLMDLFGSDVPVEGGAAGTFAWRDAPFLKAMKGGDWVLLDEMNLASQSVLEGLNAVLDHRGEVYISELDQTFQKHENFRVFAAQNPHHQGGGRKGLPASFVNRFTVVYADVFRPEDLTLICKKIFPHIEEEEASKLIRFVAELDDQVSTRRAFGNLGAPWEFNLRDTLRWLELIAFAEYSGSARDFLDVIFVQRFRTTADRFRLEKLFADIYGPHESRISLFHNLSTKSFQVGLGVLSRDATTTRPDMVSTLRIPQLGPMESLLVSIKQNWPIIIVGPPGSGKTAIINQLASFVGADLITFSMNADIDAMDLVGGYEQIDPSRELHQRLVKLETFARRRLASMAEPSQPYVKLLECLQSSSVADSNTIISLTEMIPQSDVEACELLQHLQTTLLSSSHQIDGARFQWVDGILIRALEQGKWLVLDNANLCSSAVLDRLNSLLEPNGYLSINEHSMADGEARLVRPHPEFRIFLTMDPRFGELSRAMRNRAVEIFLVQSEGDLVQNDTSTQQFPLDSAMYRFRHFQPETKNSDVEFEQQFENLGLGDTELITSFTTQISSGILLSDTKCERTNGVDTDGSQLLESTLSISKSRQDNISRFAQFIKNAWAPHVQTRHHQASSDNLTQLLPFHPLGNELSFNRSQPNKVHGLWYASMYDVVLDLYNMQHSIQNMPSARFERHKEKQKLPAFLQAYWQALVKLVSNNWRAQSSDHNLDVVGLKPLRALFWAFFSLTTGTTFDRATFQTYLKMLTAAIPAPASGTVSLQDLSATLFNQIAVFGSDVQLTTGLGMERVWHVFKPQTPKTQAQLYQLLELESFSDKLDAILWKSSLKVDEMVQLRERITGSLDLLRKDQVNATELILALQAAVVEIEKGIGEYDLTITPYFEEEFEGLCQYLDIAFSAQPTTDLRHTSLSPGIIAARAKSVLLARRPAKLRTVENGRPQHPTDHFAKLYRYLGLTRPSASPLSAEGRFHISLLAKLHAADEVQLSQLDRFEVELQSLSQLLSLDANRITEDQDKSLDRLYCEIYDQLRATHSVDIIQTFEQGQITFNTESAINKLYRSTLREGFSKCHRQVGQVDAKAWIQLGLFGLCLFIPNYPHDPALRPMIERDMFNSEKQSLLQALDALRRFQLDFTGQNSSFRIRQVEQTIHQMGQEPPVPAIVRPEVSELDDLHGELSNLLSVIQPITNGSMSVEEAIQDSTLQQNILRITQRLTGGYRAYEDITDTVVGFLVCFSIGLVLGKNDEENQAQNVISKSLVHLCASTPFFGRQEPIQSSQRLLQELEDGLPQTGQGFNVRWHALLSLSILKSTDPSSISSPAARSLLHDLFASFYGDWRAKLLRDQEKEAQNSSLYTYRGMEDEVDEDRTLFPDYEAEQEETPSALVAASQSRDYAIRLANMHADMFIHQRDASDSLKLLLEWSAGEMNRISGGKGHGTKHEDALSATYLALEKKSVALTSSGTGTMNNFYFDANLPEAKRLIKLVHRIQIRYRQVQNIWPEHSTLSEVLRTCDEVLEFRHVDPLAKLITKSEKLYAYMYEWQRVASKEYSTANLFDDLTGLLVSWRKLELTTWARLFDLEADKCRDTAKSWFFVAYETIIAASESIDEEQDVRLHNKNLLKSLEGFFETTTFGQFEQRIKLLQQLCQHTKMLKQDVDAFKIVHPALENFIAYFSHFEKPVSDAIAKGRVSLEKEVKDVIKLASWKDTNIEALKQSAKTSHRKLSKSVRKFRALLNQPVAGIMKTSFPNEVHLGQDIVMAIVDGTIDANILALCASSNIPGWAARPTRFQNLGVTVTMMRGLSTPNLNTIDGASYIIEFISELRLSIIELQKATPTTLTEENKEDVQHLKTQKRKLYADTMKELRQMGVNSNLSMDSLVKQDELSTILSSLPLISENEGTDLAGNYHLHKALNIMPQVRAVYKEHSGDLTPNDVAKSIGYLEGLLYVSIRQRSVLSKATQSLVSIETPIAVISSLCQSAEENFSLATRHQIEALDSLAPKLRWLTVMLKTGTDIVCAQAKLGKTNELDALIRDMREWTTKLEDLADSHDRLFKLPENIQSEAHQVWQQSVKTNISDFQAVFTDWAENNDIARTVLRQIQPFLFEHQDAKSVNSSDETRVSMNDYVNDIFRSLDLILGSMQDVEAALKSAPASTEDASWFVKEEQTLSATFNTFHAAQISNALQQVLGSMRNLHEANLQGIAAVFASIRPILDQYVASYKYFINRFGALHISTATLLHRLSQSFIQIGTQGFCQPPEKSTDPQKGRDDKLESGTGLGEGEGAEDISKDIEDDEDLEDLAQQKSGEREGSIEEEDDAVDMGEQEMEGETEEVGEKEDKGDEEGEEGGDDVQSEVGSVDDLGPSAVDEKMWDDGGKDEDAKDKEGEKDVGTEDQDEQVAAEHKEKEKSGKDGEKEDKKDGEEAEDEEMEGEDQEENVGVGETEKMDPHAKEEETLDLPDDLNMDGQDDEGKEDDDLGDMDMGDDLPEDELDLDNEPGAPDTVDEEIGPEQEGEEEKDTTGHVEDEEQPDDENDEDGNEPQDGDAIPLPDDNMPDDEMRDAKDTDQADPNADAGAGAEANEEAHKNKEERATASAANQDDGQEGETSEQNQETSAEDGQLGDTTRPDAGGRGEQPEESREKQSFKKLGDVLEKWYNQQKQISESREKDETQVQQIDKEFDMADADFEHLGDDDMNADTQALGTASEEQAKALDHDMAMPVNEDEEKIPTRPEDQDNIGDDEEDVEMQDAEVQEASDEKEEQQKSNAMEGQPQAFIGEQNAFPNEDQDMEDVMSTEDGASETSSVDEVETQLELTHLDPSTMTPDNARSLWLSHEAATHSLSQQLTEHLRLILAPTLATKLRGDFRTGKRLNLKRIIPYIASGYKRDKIWLRRSQPSKRSYQVMIALDDSKSMAESGASNLALKTLTLVTKSLSMLEVGEVSVVGFGDQVNVAHDFDKPFTSEAGVRVFEQFGFDAAKTNVRGLVDKSLELFAEARRKGPSSAGEDLWQLMLIVSDGICDSHAEIQRLVRKAQEERVMIVFIIIDSSATPSSDTVPPPPASDSATQPSSSLAITKEKEKTSILDLQSVVITPEGKVVRWKYMERFPFRYYLVVRDVRELPGVLAGALRQWFGEVAGSA